MERKMYNKHTLNTIKIVSKVTENQIIEEIYRPKNNKYLFVIYNGKKTRFQESFSIAGKKHIPLKSSLIDKQVVLLPSDIEEYHSKTSLIKQIKSFIHKYYEYPQKFFEDLDAYYVLHTWNYDKYSVTPYRRVLGDYGTGKTRFLKVVGSICYRPTFISSASSKASIYRIIDSFYGTVILDEADFYNSNLYATIIKILNCGHQKGTPVVKCKLETFEPQAFEVYCPKLIASKQRYEDQALESRCITHETDIHTREDIPIILPPEFYKEAEVLRNKLLLWKLRNYRKKVQLDTEFQSLPVEPRLKEAIIPLASIVDDLKVRKNLENFVLEYHQNLMRERGLGTAKIILESIIQLKAERVPLAVGNIASRVREKLHILYEGDFTPKRCGSIIGKELRLYKKREKVDGVPIVVVWDKWKIQRLCLKYGVEFNNLTYLTSAKDKTDASKKTDKSTLEGFIPLNKVKNVKTLNLKP